MDISRKISLPLLLILFEIAILLTSSCYYYPNHVFALQQNPLLQKNDNDNINDNNITKKFTLIADENVVRISPNDNFFHPTAILYKAMTFNYTIPGPVIVVDQGDTFQITLQNKGKLVHSLDLHGIEGSSQALSGAVKPGESKTWKVKAVNTGVFMYHCDGDNLNGIWDHIASGMYGGIVVHSKDERRPAKEFYVVFGEVYNTADKGFFMDATNTNATKKYATTTTIANLTNEKKSVIQMKEEQIGSFDMNKFIANKPDLILTNGMAYKYIPFFGAESKIILNKDAELFKVKPGELTRWYIVNAGPRGYLAFNFASGMVNSVVYDSGSNNSNKSVAIGRNNDNAIHPRAFENNKTTLSLPSKKIYEVSIPPGSAEAIEVTFPEEGTYVGNDHDIGRFLIGAGFVVVATNNSTSNDHPKETWVPPYGYGNSNNNNNTHK